MSSKKSRLQISPSKWKTARGVASDDLDAGRTLRSLRGGKQVAAKKASAARRQPAVQLSLIFWAVAARKTPLLGC